MAQLSFTSYRYKSMTGFNHGGRSKGNGDDKEPPRWKMLLIVLLAMSLLGIVIFGLDQWVFS